MDHTVDPASADASAMSTDVDVVSINRRRPTLRSVGAFVLELSIYGFGIALALNAFAAIGWFAFTRVRVVFSLTFLALAAAGVLLAIVGAVRHSELKYALCYAVAWCVVLGAFELIDKLTINDAFR